MKAAKDREIKVEEPMKIKWPDGWPRTLIGNRLENKGYKKTVRQARDGVVLELQKMGVSETLICYDVTNERMDPGVAVYFSKKMDEDYSWQDALGLESPMPTIQEIDQAFRKKAEKHHPDRVANGSGGDVELYYKLDAARKQAKAWILGTHTVDHEYCIPFDMYKEIRWNLNAVRSILAHFRALEKLGNPDMVERSFRGFKAALPSQASEAKA